MDSRLNEIKRKLLSEQQGSLGQRVSLLILCALCFLSVASLGYLFLITPMMRCHSPFFYLAAVWLVMEMMVIGYLYVYKNIPKFARDAIVVMVLISNVWFLLFVFSLKACNS